MTMATETENNGPESKEIKDVKEMKEALKDDAPPDNKQEEKDAAKKDEAAGKKDDDAAAAAGGTNAASAKANTVHHPDYEKDVVYLYQFPRTPLLPSLSPYGLKVETWLRLNGIKYEVSVRERFLFFFSLSSSRSYRASPRLDSFLRSCVCSIGPRPGAEWEDRFLYISVRREETPVALSRARFDRIPEPGS